MKVNVMASTRKTAATIDDLRSMATTSALGTTAVTERTPPRQFVPIFGCVLSWGLRGGWGAGDAGLVGALNDGSERVLDDIPDDGFGRRQRAEIFDLDRVEVRAQK